MEKAVPMDARQLGYTMCRDSLGGVWAEIDENQFEITPLSGGLTNYLYVCSLPSEVQAPDNQPRSVLLRVYGDIATSSSFVVQNSVIFALMSEKGLGPKLYGMNPKARIEALLPANCLQTVDLHNSTISRQIAEKLALFHSLDMPLCKEPRFLNKTMDDWSVKVRDTLRRTCSRDEETYMQKFRNYHLEEELETLKLILSLVDSPVVFSHNDLQEGNILYTKEENAMTVIDWEYCSYNYRGYDFGNHFIEWCYNYQVEEDPKFKVNLDNYPSRQQQEEFFRAYLRTLDRDITDDLLQLMYVEANTFVLASHFFWGLWSILQNNMSTIEFGFLEYAESRLDAYFLFKDRLPSEIVERLNQHRQLKHSTV
ncbi:hypothetical protein DPMN_011444 [Dreissena polymorpha]|uniref:Choline kinase alpha n=2 Tax=Dreissena polymorpha TaxID=45954 RepID=A0A9D4N655_DREPO|nr:hypothetical protein DPMN_011444 [Dreissena polymorpha]